MKQCAFLTMDNLEEFECYDSLLYAPLATRGWKVTPVSWQQTNPDWNSYEVVVIRSPWDYQDDPQRFIQVLADIDSSSARLENPLDLVKWNIDKGYLRDLQNKEIGIVPSIFSNLFTPSLCRTFFDKLGSDEIVIKPTISANADDTFRLTSDSPLIEKLETVFDNRDFLVQPFMKQIVEEGEYSLFYFGGEYSHAILKTPRQDDFRVQEEHGGTLKLIEPEKQLLKLGQKTFSSLSPSPLYGRVDFVRADDTFLLMELELIEPSLYFNMDPNSPDRFAEAFVNWMNNGTLSPEKLK